MPFREWPVEAVELLDGKVFRPYRDVVIAWREWPVGAWMGTKKAKERIVEFFHALAPVNDWPAKHVGESELDAYR